MGLREAFTALGLAAVCTVASLSGVSAQAADTTPAAAPGVKPPRPNVVIVYVDDVGPGITRLWSDRTRTPELARFVREGVEFRHAVTSTPLCGPSRATLLTGQYGHHHHVTDNQAAKFRPRGTLAPRLKRAGYHTILVGKYINGLDEAAPRRPEVRRYAQGWKRFDVIWKRATEGQGQFYDYLLWTRHGVKAKGHAPKDHSTYVIGQRVAKHIRKAPRHKPVFALVSLAAGHVPHTPLAWHRGSDACHGISPYAPPSYDERSVRDKPIYIRKLPRLAPPALRLRSHCEEMLGIDAALARIRDALEASGRLDDTLLLFTSDNGYLYGDHRMPLPGGKKWPHAVEVPLYALWPARLGNEPRVVREPVSNVDLPVTICRLAGCRLRDPDGQDISPLLTGEAGQIGRRFLYTEMLRAWEGMPPWYGLVTTRRYDGDAIWQYTEYANGGHELYDLTRDPYRLRNLAREPGHKQRMRKLHRILHHNVIRANGVKLP